MKSYALCPVSDKKVNERVARINGIFTVLLIVVSGLTGSIIPLIFLAVDFCLRSFDFARYSLVAVSSRGIVSYLHLNEHMINAGPKIFAARIGLMLSSLIITLFFFHMYLPALALAGILGLFSFLEGAFGICVACEIYPFVYRLFYKVRFYDLRIM
jgi:hypothetical protein